MSDPRMAPPNGTARAVGWSPWYPEPLMSPCPRHAGWPTVTISGSIGTSWRRQLDGYIPTTYVSLGRRC